MVSSIEPCGRVTLTLRVPTHDNVMSYISRVPWGAPSNHVFPGCLTHGKASAHALRQAQADTLFLLFLLQNFEKFYNSA
jgi:hypothetical protein